MVLIQLGAKATMVVVAVALLRVRLRFAKTNKVRCQTFLTLFYIRLPSNITVFSDICLNRAHVLKAQNKCSQLLLFTQNQQIFCSIIISRWRISFDYVGIETIDYFQSTTTFRVISGKDDFSL